MTDVISTLSTIPETLLNCPQMNEYMSASNIGICFHQPIINGSEIPNCYFSGGITNASETLYIKIWPRAMEHPAKTQSSNGAFLSAIKTLFYNDAAAIKRNEMVVDIARILLNSFGDSKTEFDSIHEEANQGKLSLGRYVEERIMHEYSGVKKVSKYSADCFESWGLNKEAGSCCQKMKGAAELFFRRIANGAMGHIENEWVEHYKKEYCPNNKTDGYSCERNLNIYSPRQITKDKKIDDLLGWYVAFTKNEIDYSERFKLGLTKSWGLLKDKVALIGVVDKIYQEMTFK